MSAANWLFGRGPRRVVRDDLVPLFSPTVVVTDRGVEIPLNNAHGWSVSDLANLLGEINELPELEPGSRRV